MSSMVQGGAAPTSRSTVWRWYMCALLLLATTINYLDRQTLSSVSERITTELSLTNEQYGELELAFGLAFAAGAFCFGILADRIGVFWLYPTVLLLWSATGFLTGLVEPFYIGSYFVDAFLGLLVCRTMLGLFEAGHWPCALKTTQRLLPPRDRALGNSLLQGGTSIGAVLTPLIVLAFLTDQPGSWRPPFMVIGAIGTVWIVLWLFSIRPADLSAAPPQDSAHSPIDDDEPSFLEIVFTQRFLVLVVIVIAINLCWHLFRVWLPKFLMRGRGYEETFTLQFISIFYLATEVGVLTAGALAWLLVRKGMSVHRSRVWIFGICAVLTTLTTAAAFLPQGWPLLGVLLVIGFANLGLFPFYYSFSQELTVKHQGKVSGLLGVFAWIVPAVIHKFVGKYVDQTQSYDLPIGLAGWTPLLSLVLLLLLWNRPGKARAAKPPAPSVG